VARPPLDEGVSTRRGGGFGTSARRNWLCPTCVVLTRAHTERRHRVAEDREEFADARDPTHSGVPQDATDLFNSIKAGIPAIAPRGTRAGDFAGVTYGASRPASSAPARNESGKG